ncbi:DUF1836 domain-containing protein [Streptococcus pseudoporcinus]|uniref:BS_ykrK family protein n=1 Tax=Streptococcus pseudoporcinus TaxID=361101 RepID=A0A4U9XNJ7_9STRE|nr:DUF1836 domain-containing protein [Streptococcus pseudoporcinus]VTS14669.1 BS_ykrK family protein [Streptococcus pseudoporcinus]VUC67310.1 BS_ykrK family protein [Streptococcus pseudoporcinus]VUC98238.1 BS_ykrK family protein [Streptococcus pseudoporcinus]VUC98628.1 BS_ykrK family protein [Streptococcus pseudoporcinus]
MKSNIFPNWENLPEIDLYLDQVLLYVNQVATIIEPNQQKPLTASMVNNYVKHGYLEKPFKKKYARHQLARLIAIAILKHSFPIQDISQVLQGLRDKKDSEQLYTAFVHYWNSGQTDGVDDIIIAACKTVKYYCLTFSLMENE